MNFAERLKKNIQVSIAAKQDFLRKEEQLNVFQQAVNAVTEAYRKGGRLYIAGNGGSAADAQHLAAEFVSKLSRDRMPLPAEALTVDSSMMTAIANDYGFEQVFARQIEGKLRPEDIFLGITTSGNSKNLTQALEQCRRMGIVSLVFSGKGGGRAKQLADFCIVASGEETSTIQEMHIVFAHTLCACVESELLFKDLDNPSAG